MKIMIGICLLLWLGSSLALNGKCRALVMSGAGSQGAYQAAVIQGLTNHDPNPEVNLAWDVVSGVSAGSLNAWGMGGFEANDTYGGPEFIYALWDSIPDNQAFGNWPGGIIQGLFQKAGMFDMSPGIKWVTERFDSRVIKRKISFGTTDSRTAEYVVYDYNATNTFPGDYIESAFASSSIPAAFPPVERDGRTLVDGGVIWNNDIPSAIRRCREIVDKDEDIIIDTILVGNHEIEQVSTLAKYKPLDHYFRAREINSFYNYMSDYRTSMNMFKDVKFNYLIFPSGAMPGGSLPLDFSRDGVDKCFEVGKRDAKNAAAVGAQVYRDLALDYADKKKLGLKPNFDKMIEEKLRELGKFKEESS